MIQYMSSTLGIEVTRLPWEKTRELPLYLRGGRDYSVLNIYEIECLCIEIEPTVFRLSTYLKQMAKLAEFWKGPILLQFQALTAYQRKALIEHRIAFVVPESQLFFPQIGIVLQERMRPQQKQIERLSSNAQAILLWMIGQKRRMVRQNELVSLFEVSAMTVTRSVQELSQLGLIRVEKVGREQYLYPAYQRRELFEKAKEYLTDPVYRRVYVEKNLELTSLPLSGLSALGEKTMLNPPNVLCRAISSKAFKTLNVRMVDPSWERAGTYVELEVWNYDPGLLAEMGVVDTLSLMLALQKENDDRTVMALEEMMEEYRW